jgi:hypothetical protein
LRKKCQNLSYSLLGVEVSWDRCGAEPAGEYTFFYGKGNKNHEVHVLFYIRESCGGPGSSGEQMKGPGGPQGSGAGDSLIRERFEKKDGQAAEVPEGDRRPASVPEAVRTTVHPTPPRRLGPSWERKCKTAPLLEKSLRDLEKKNPVSAFTVTPTLSRREPPHPGPLGDGEPGGSRRLRKVVKEHCTCFLCL